jgi:transglutaminase-like putative cysteine protease
MGGFALLHKGISYLLAYLGLAGLALGGELDLVTLAVLASLFASTWLVEGARLASPTLQRGITIALVVALVVQLLRGFLGEPALGLALAWSGALQASRLAIRRTAREHLQIAFLAFLHLCAATVLSTEITYALCFIGFVIVVPWMLALTHLRAEIEAQHASRAGEESGDEGERITLPPQEKDVSLQRTLSSRTLVGAPFLIGTALLSVPLFLFTAAIFVAFPRVGLGYLAFGSERGEAVSGFGDDVELGQVGRIRDDRTVILRVTPPNLPERPERQVEFYLRGTSFDHYDGRRWSRTSRNAGAPLEEFLQQYTITRTPRPEIDAPLRIVLDHLDQTVVFLPEHTVALEVPPRVINGSNQARRIELYPGLDIRYEDDDALGLRYTAWVSRSPRLEVVRALPSDELARYLQVPEGHEALRALARDWTRDARGDRERAEQIMGHLRRAPFAYSLDMQDPGGRPPLERFLLEWHTGHCEYYASAMVVLLRMVGVPARNVTGFLGGTYNAYGRYYAVTSGDAHAWVEAYLPGEGWVRFDPTPSSRSTSSLSSLWNDLQDLGDAAVTWWESAVVGYDLRSQGQIARGALQFFRAQANTRREDTPQGERTSAPSWLWLGLLGLVVIGALLWQWRRRTSKPASDLPDALRPLVALLTRIDRLLAQRGMPRSPAQTLQERADQLTAQGFDGEAVVQRVTQLYYRARFGGETLSAESLRALEAEVRGLEQRRKA